MQEWFPEGFVFTWSLYGAASAQVARALPSTNERRAHLLAETERAVRQVRSSNARSTFDPNLDPPYGAFYTSWSLYLLAEYARAAGASEMPDDLRASFEEDCAGFAAALNRNDSPFLSSYWQGSWPADTAVGIAALAIHDRTFPPHYAPTIDSWVAKARRRTNRELGALSHAADPATGAPVEGVRGSSLALMSRMLVEASPELAHEQYAVLRRHFVDYTWGVPGVREYPHGVAGTGDVDSGPIFLGYSGPAVVVGAAAARAHGDETLANTLFAAVEVGGVTIELGGERRYAGGLVPLGDAFIAWARSSPLPPAPQRSEWAPLVPTWWAVPAHALSTVIVVLILLRVLRARRARRHDRD